MADWPEQILCSPSPSSSSTATLRAAVDGLVAHTPAAQTMSLDRPAAENAASSPAWQSRTSCGSVMMTEAADELAQGDMSLTVDAQQVARINEDMSTRVDTATTGCGLFGVVG